MVNRILVQYISNYHGYSNMSFRFHRGSNMNYDVFAPGVSGTFRPFILKLIG